MENPQKKYRVVVLEINEYEETAEWYRDPETGEEYESKYSFDNEVRHRLVFGKKFTGRKIQEQKEVLNQVVEGLDLTSVIKAVNKI